MLRTHSPNATREECYQESRPTCKLSSGIDTLDIIRDFHSCSFNFISCNRVAHAIVPTNGLVWRFFKWGAKGVLIGYSFGSLIN